MLLPHDLQISTQISISNAMLQMRVNANNKIMKTIKELLCLNLLCLNFTQIFRRNNRISKIFMSLIILRRDTYILKYLGLFTGNKIFRSFTVLFTSLQSCFSYFPTKELFSML